MQCDDLLCRSVLFPKSFPNDVFDVEALLRLQDADGTYALSVASRYLLETEQAAHKYGCRTAKASNARFFATQNRKPEPHEAVHYLGFYDLKFGEVMDIELDFYRVSVRWKPEHGEDAHFEIGLEQKAVKSSDRERKNDRKTARTLLALCLSGPQRFICDEDEADRERLTAIDLPHMPLPDAA